MHPSLNVGWEYVEFMWLKFKLNTDYCTVTLTITFYYQSCWRRGCCLFMKTASAFGRLFWDLYYNLTETYGCDNGDILVKKKGYSHVLSTLCTVSCLHLLRASLDMCLSLVVRLQMQIVSINCWWARWYLLNFFSHIPTVSGLSSLFSFLCFQLIHIYLSANGQLNKIAIVCVVINNLHNTSFWGNFIFLCASANCVS